MKKILLGLFALSSVASFAMERDFNVYTKLGVDTFSRYSKLVDEEDGTVLAPKKGKFALSLFLEGTKNVTPNLELGLGLGYITRKNVSHSLPFEAEFVEAVEGDEEIEVDEEAGKVYKGTSSYKFPRYKSFPLYLIAKYNFDLGSEFKPYVKADLGYSFNKINKSSITYNYKATSEDGELVIPSEKYDGHKVKNGLYTALSAGVEYNNLLAELSYAFSKAKIKDDEGSRKYNNRAVRLSVGYKFNF